MMREMIKSSQQSGRSMIEMLGVLAIIGVLSVGGIAGYSQAMAKFKVTKATDQIQQMVTNVRTLYASARNYGSISTKLLYQAGAIGDDVCNGDTSCSSPVNTFGGDLTVNYAGNGNKNFSINYGGLPREACAKLASYDWGDSSSGLLTVTIGSTVVCNTSLASNCPADISLTTSTCGDTDNKIIFVFR